MAPPAGAGATDISANGRPSDDQDLGRGNSRELFRPAKPVRAFEEIITQIRALIADGHLEAGDKLPAERNLASQLKVSRNTVREALRMLEISGYVTLRRGARGGAFIANPEGDKSVGLLGHSLRFTDFSVADLTHAMRSITMMLLESALPRFDDKDLEAIAANIALAERTEDPTERSGVIINFYVLLAQATRNRILVDIAKSFCDILLSWVLRLGPLDSARVLASRKRILVALRANRPGDATAELDRHLNEVHDLWLKGSKAPT